MNERTRYEMTAAEYVLGTLRGPARRRFEVLMARDAALAAEVSRWQEALSALDAADVPLEPPGRVWRTIQLRLPAQSPAPMADFREQVVAPASAPDSAPVRGAGASGGTKRVQRGWQFFSFALAASLVVTLFWPRLLVWNGEDIAPRPVAVLASTQAGSARQMVASFDARHRQLVLTPLNMEIPETGHSLQLWLIAKGQKPASLGLIKAQASTVIALDKGRLGSDVTLAVSLEPAGGSPTGQPTGAVLYAGKVGRI
ncbi:anti-sigma factor [Paralcaligenes ureilyticus]|uniref:Anti-sigma-K factor RskA n=1 Tax=Paralcaligenes ureilyticus TaxID=627131 RepID=A0A4R3LYI9_9BURK|nr:anti-sigma factor [Paralcaligenes ureilyticus]TCT05774.1 anti-sigma-K factor RskA [Paralcaligenes ureilyticus]